MPKSRKLILNILNFLQLERYSLVPILSSTFQSREFLKEKKSYTLIIIYINYIKFYVD